MLLLGIDVDTQLIMPWQPTSVKITLCIYTSAFISSFSVLPSPSISKINPITVMRWYLCGTGGIVHPRKGLPTSKLLMANCDICWRLIRHSLTSNLALISYLDRRHWNKSSITSIGIVYLWMHFWPAYRQVLLGVRVLLYWLGLVDPPPAFSSKSALASSSQNSTYRDFQHLMRHNPQPLATHRATQKWTKISYQKAASEGERRVRPLFYDWPSSGGVLKPISPDAPWIKPTQAILRRRTRPRIRWQESSSEIQLVGNDVECVTWKHTQVCATSRTVY